MELWMFYLLWYLELGITEAVYDADFFTLEGEEEFWVVEDFFEF